MVTPVSATQPPASVVKVGVSPLADPRPSVLQRANEIEKYAGPRRFEKHVSIPRRRALSSSSGLGAVCSSSCNFILAPPSIRGLGSEHSKHPAALAEDKDAMEAEMLLFLQGCISYFPANDPSGGSRDTGPVRPDAPPPKARPRAGVDKRS